MAICLKSYPVKTPQEIKTQIKEEKFILIKSKYMNSAGARLVVD